MHKLVHSLRCGCHQTVHKLVHLLATSPFRVAEHRKTSLVRASIWEHGRIVFLHQGVFWTGTCCDWGFLCWEEVVCLLMGLLHGSGCRSCMCIRACMRSLTTSMSQPLSN
jgi:hypothetical protein